MLQASTSSLTSIPTSDRSNWISEPSCTTSQLSSINFTFTSQELSSKCTFFPNGILNLYPDVMHNLNKWGFDSRHMSIHRFSFDHAFSDYLLLPFLKQFFMSSDVLQTLKVLYSETDTWTSLGQVDPDSIAVDQLTTDFSDLSLFNCLFENEILRDDGSIKPCFDTQLTCNSTCLGAADPISSSKVAVEPPRYETDIMVSDELRVCLLDNASDTFSYFPIATSRKEVLFHIFFHLVVGGRINQFEDNVGPYFDAVKAFSRTFLRVAKNKDSSISIRSLVYRVLNLKSNLAPLFPSAHPQNFLLLFIDPVGRQIVTWYHASPSYYL